MCLLSFLFFSFCIHACELRPTNLFSICQVKEGRCARYINAFKEVVVMYKIGWKRVGGVHCEASWSSSEVCESDGTDIKVTSTIPPLR